MKLIWYILMWDAVVLTVADGQVHLKNCLYYIVSQHIDSSLTLIISDKSQTSENMTTELQQKSIVQQDVLDSVLQELQHSSRWPISLLEMGTKKQEILQQTNDSYILISTKDYHDGVINDIRQQASITTKEKDSNSRAKYVVAIIHNFNNPMNLAKDVLSVLWDFKLINTIVLIPTEEHDIYENNTVYLIDVYTWFPFGQQGRCANVSDAVLLDRWISDNSKQHFLKQTPLFPYKTPKNLRSCPITVSTFLYPPFVFDKREEGDDIRYEEGLEVRLLKEITGRLNMKIKFRKPSPDYWGVDLGNGSWNGVSGEVVKGYSDIGLLGYFNKAHIINGLDYSSTYLIEHLKWWVPCAKPIDRWKSLIIVFDLSLWLGFLAAYIIVSIVIWVVAKLSSVIEGHEQHKAYKSIIKCFLNFWAIIVEESASNNPPRVTAIRLIFLAWVLYCWAVNTVYQTYLVTFLVDPGFEHQLSSETEIFDSDITLGIVDAVLTCCVPDLERYPLHRRHRCTDYIKCLETIGKGYDLAFIFASFHLEHVTLSSYLDSSGNPLICPMPEQLDSQPVVMPFTKGSLFQQRFDDIITRILEAGVIMHWWKYLKYMATLSSMSGLEAQSEEYIKLSLEHLESVFIFLSMGCIISSLVFAIEFFSVVKIQQKGKLWFQNLNQRKPVVEADKQ